MKNNLKNLTLAALALAIAPLAHAQTTLFNSATSSWTETANDGSGTLVTSSQDAGGDGTTLSVPTGTTLSSVNTVGSQTYGNGEGEDYFTLANAITTGSGTYTLSATVSDPVVNQSFNAFTLGFGNFNLTNLIQNNSTTATLPINNTGGPYIQDARSLNGSYSGQTAAIHFGGVATGTTITPTDVTNPEANQAAPIQLTLVLDTSTPLWTAEEYVDGTLVKTLDFTSNPTISGIGIGIDGAGSVNATSVDFSNVTLTDTAAPEPSTYALLFGGLGMFFLFQRMRKSSMNI